MVGAEGAATEAVIGLAVIVTVTVLVALNVEMEAHTAERAVQILIVTGTAVVEVTATAVEVTVMPVGEGRPAMKGAPETVQALTIDPAVVHVQPMRTVIECENL